MTDEVSRPRRARTSSVAAKAPRTRPAAGSANAASPEGALGPKQGDITLNLGSDTGRAAARAIGALAIETQADLREAIWQLAAAAYRRRLRGKFAKMSDVEAILRGLDVAMKTGDLETIAAMANPAKRAIRNVDQFGAPDLMNRAELGSYIVARVKTYLDDAKQRGVDELPDFVPWIALFLKVGQFKYERPESIETALQTAFRRNPPTSRSKADEVAVDILEALGLTRTQARNDVNASPGMHATRSPSSKR